MSDSTVIDLEKTQDFIISEKGGALIRKKSDMVDYSVINEGMKREKLIFELLESTKKIEVEIDGNIVHLRKPQNSSL
ncbi:MAG: hypothetical protein PHP30_10030 [Bacteroidales bacterium]|nr:hypothetical protein [Bacteroidales bacterium]MDD2426223.1 hypothetical protein [Bacteroidales bacterium]MDD3990413.1 hypothetical protein [Bacteroidales bacterium]